MDVDCIIFIWFCKHFIPKAIILMISLQLFHFIVGFPLHLPHRPFIHSPIIYFWICPMYRAAVLVIMVMVVGSDRRPDPKASGVLSNIQMLSTNARILTYISLSQSRVIFKGLVVHFLTIHMFNILRGRRSTRGDNNDDMPILWNKKIILGWNWDDSPQSVHGGFTYFFSYWFNKDLLSSAWAG